MQKAPDESEAGPLVRSGQTRILRHALIPMCVLSRNSRLTAFVSRQLPASGKKEELEERGSTLEGAVRVEYLRDEYGEGQTDLI